MIQSKNIFELVVNRKVRDSNVERNCTAWDTLIAEKFHHGRFEKIYNWLSPEYEWHGPGGWSSKASDDFIDLIKEARAGVPDIRFTNQLIGSGNMVANLWSVTGTHQGNYIGIPGTGNHINYAGIALGRFEDGRLIEEWELWDTFALAQSLGVIESSCSNDNLIDILGKDTRDSLVKYPAYNFMLDEGISSPAELMYPSSAVKESSLEEPVRLNIASWKTYIKKLLGESVLTEEKLNEYSDKRETTILESCNERFSCWPVSLIKAMFPDIKCEVRAFGEGDFIASHMVWHGRHTGAVTGIPATGNKVCFTSISIAKFTSDSQLDQHWSVMEDITLLQQLGVAVKDKTQNLLTVFK